MANSYPSTPPLQTRFITVEMADVSTAASVWVVPGFRGKLKKITSIINGAIATGDAGITVEIGGTAVTGGAVTIATAASAAGDIDTAVPTALNTFSDAQALEIITDGVSTNTVIAVFTLECEPI